MLNTTEISLEKEGTCDGEREPEGFQGVGEWTFAELCDDYNCVMIDLITFE